MTDLVERLSGPDDVLAREPPLPAPRRALPITRAARPSFAASLTTALLHRRVFILLPFAAALGIVGNVALPADPNLFVLGGLGGVLAIAGLALRRSLGGLRAVALLTAVLAGFFLIPLHGVLLGTPMLARPVYGTLRATIDEVISATPGEARVIVSGIVWDGVDRTPGLRRARLLIRGGPMLAPGDVITGPFRLAPVPGAAYPGGYDAQFQGYFDGVGAYGNSTAAPQIVATGGPGLVRGIGAIRDSIAARIDAVLQQPAAGVARAIINGDQSAVSQDVRDVMATAGIAHVLSVSGLHLTIVAGGVFWVLRLFLAGFEGLAQWVSVKRVAAVAGMASAVGYFAISGGNIAALRSTLMILLVFGAVLFGRRALTMRNVAIAGLIILATDPAGLFRPSFQLSFSAVIGLIGAYEGVARDRSARPGFFAHGFGYVKGIVITSVVAGLSTLLFSVYHFQQTSPLGVLGNLGTLPLVGFVMMPAAALAVALMPVGLDRPFLLATGWSIDRMIEMASLVAAWSSHLRAAPLLGPAALLIGLGALAWFAFFRDRWRLLGPALAVPLVLLFGLDSRPDVLIADTTHTTAILGPNGLALADGKPKSFILDVWRGTYAAPIAVAAVKSCDAIACIGTSPAGFSYALVFSTEGFAEECEAEDLIIARIVAPSWCHAKAVVDAAALARGGVHWLRWDDAAKRFEIRRAIVSTARPWRPAVRP